MPLLILLVLATVELALIALHCAYLAGKTSRRLDIQAFVLFTVILLLMALILYHIPSDQPPWNDEQ